MCSYFHSMNFFPQIASHFAEEHNELTCISNLFHSFANYYILLICLEISMNYTSYISTLYLYELCIYVLVIHICIQNITRE